MRGLNALRSKARQVMEQNASKMETRNPRGAEQLYKDARHIENWGMEAEEGWVGLSGLGWVGLGWVGLGWVGFHWISLDFIGFHWIQSDWVRSGSISARTFDPARCLSPIPPLPPVLGTLIPPPGARHDAAQSAFRVSRVLALQEARRAREAAVAAAAAEAEAARVAAAEALARKEKEEEEARVREEEAARVREEEARLDAEEAAAVAVVAAEAKAKKMAARGV